MKRLVSLMLVFIMVMVFSGCTRTNDLDDNNGKNNTNNGTTTGNGTGTTNRNNTGNNTGINTNGTTGAGTGNGTTTGMGDLNINDTGVPLGNVNSNYVTSVRNIDTRLRTALKGISPAQTGSTNYYTTQSTNYTTTANAYRDALNSLNGLSYNDTNRSYHEALMRYYQGGYDTYKNLSSRYSGFKTSTDENAYRTGAGKNAYNIGTDLEDAYQNALNRLGINLENGDVNDKDYNRSNNGNAGDNINR